MTRMEGKTAIVTGGGKGMGEAAVRLLAAEGANVVIAVVDADAADALASELGPKARFERLDVRSPEQWDEVADNTESFFGSVDVLVNNAGIAIPSIHVSGDALIISERRGVTRTLTTMRIAEPSQCT
ncbi:SDR family NAD(P)-dependent oxidoreductase [Mesorhizobium sp. M0659]|uniref:SDR family NAD(P)-dependent oxidoreductase n=1 Tax=Mesorhizobium sp. M0659 TaxID=2956980 RepID=UPI00333B40F5